MDVDLTVDEPCINVDWMVDEPCIDVDRTVDEPLMEVSTGNSKANGFGAKRC